VSGFLGPGGLSELYYDFQTNWAIVGIETGRQPILEFYKLLLWDSPPDAAGVLTPLAQPQIDTGLGLGECPDLQASDDNNETD